MGDAPTKQPFWDEQLTPPSVKPILFYCAIFLTAIAIRAIYLFELSASPFAEILLGDSQKFDLWAQELATGDWIGSGVFFHAPLYPYFLGLLYATFGRSLLLIKVLQILLGGLACLLIAETGRNLISRKTGLIAGLLAAFYPAAIFYDGLIHKTSLGFFFTTLLLYTISKHCKTPKFSWITLSGLTMGALILVRQNAALFAGIVLFWLAVGFTERRWRQRMAWMGCFLAGMCVILFPVALRNKLVGGEFVLTTSNFGMNFYIGNNVKATGTYEPLRWGRGDWSFEHEDVVSLAEEQAGRPLKATEVSRYWTRQAVNDIAADPVKWLKLLCKKWLLTWGAIEIGDSESIYAHGDWSVVIGLLSRLLNYGLLIPLAAVGLWAGWPLRKTIWPLYIMLLGYASSITVIFVFDRYRHPMTALVFIFSGLGLCKIASAIRQKNYTALIISALIVTAVAPMTNRDILAKNDMIATTYYNVASTIEQEGGLTDAIRYYRRSLDLNPNHVMAMNNLAIAYFKLGDLASAQSLLENALKIDANLPEVHNNIGLIAAAQGDYQSAGDHFRKVIQLNPAYSPSVYYNLACISALSYETDAAVDWLETAVLKGYRNWQTIQTDPDLANIRRSERFRAFLSRNGKYPDRTRSNTDLTN